MQLAKVMFDAIELLPHSSHFGNGHGHCSEQHNKHAQLVSSRFVPSLYQSLPASHLPCVLLSPLFYAFQAPSIHRYGGIDGHFASGRALDMTVDAKPDEALLRLNTT